VTVDLGETRTMRAVELRTRGRYGLVGPTLRAETSADGVIWTTAAEQGTGALALAGALRAPLEIPLRLLLPDPSARFLRLNVAAFGADAVTIYGPRTHSSGRHD
jgi:hypothetical protein